MTSEQLIKQIISDDITKLSDIHHLCTVKAFLRMLPSIQGMKLAILIRIVLTLLLFGILVFVPYGSLLWLEAWIFFGIIFLYIILTLPWFMKNNPQLVANRMTYTPSEGSDKIFTLAATVDFILFFTIIGFDAGQSHIAPVPDLVKILGFVGIIFSFFFFFFTLKENTFASRIIEVKDDQIYFFGHSCSV